MSGPGEPTGGPYAAGEMARSRLHGGGWESISQESWNSLLNLPGGHMDMDITNLRTSVMLCISLVCRVLGVMCSYKTPFVYMVQHPNGV